MLHNRLFQYLASLKILQEIKVIPVVTRRNHHFVITVTKLSNSVLIISSLSH